MDTTWLGRSWFCTSRFLSQKRHGKTSGIPNPNSMQSLHCSNVLGTSAPKGKTTFMSSNKAILRFPVEFDTLYTDKGYWPYALVELPGGDRFSVYFAQICSFDLPTMHDPRFGPPGLIAES